MKITFNPDADDDLDQIFSRIVRDNPSAAYRAIARIESTVRKLAHPAFSHMGHAGLVRDTFEILQRPYVIVYKINKRKQEIIILAVVHGARDR
jgi:addiction module RelE/StbE family toxin